MLIYFLLLTYTLFLSLCFDKNKQKGKSFERHFWFLAVLCILISGLRYHVGGDVIAFEEDFELIPDDGGDYTLYFFTAFQKGYMPFWILLNIGCKFLFNSFIAVQFIEAIVVNVTVFYFVRKESICPFFTVAIYLFLEYFNLNTEVMREAFAISLGMWAMNSYFNRKKFQFYLLSAIALLFHISAIALFLFPIIKFSSKIRTLVVAIIISFVIYMVSNTIAASILGQSLGILGFNEGLSYKASSYLNSTVTIWGFVLSLIQRLIIPGLFFLFAFNDDKESDFNYKKPKLVSYYITLAIVTCGIAGLYRFMNYMCIYYVIFLSNFLFYRNKSIRGMLVPKLIILFAVLYFRTGTYLKFYPGVQRYNYEFWVPYTSVFNDNPDVDFRDAMLFEAQSSATNDNFRQ